MRIIPMSVPLSLWLAVAGCAIGTGAPSPAGPIDSATAVDVGLQALRSALRDDRAYKVLEFRRDNKGVIIYFSPVRPEGIIGGGGGARVRVLNDRRAKVVEFGI